MFEGFVTAFIIYFVVIDPIGNAPIFLAVTEAQDRAEWGRNREDMMRARERGLSRQEYEDQQFEDINDRLAETPPSAEDFEECAVLGAQRVEQRARRRGRVERHVLDVQGGAQPCDEVVVAATARVAHDVGFAVGVTDEGGWRESAELGVLE